MECTRSFCDICVQQVCKRQQLDKAVYRYEEDLPLRLEIMSRVLEKASPGTLIRFPRESFQIHSQVGETQELRDGVKLDSILGHTLVTSSRSQAKRGKHAYYLKFDRGFWCIFGIDCTIRRCYPARKRLSSRDFD